MQILFLIGLDDNIIRGSDTVHIFISKLPISSPHSMLDHLLESSHRDDSNKWSNMECSEEIAQVVLIKVNYRNLIWSSTGKMLAGYIQQMEDFICYSFRINLIITVIKSSRIGKTESKKAIYINHI